MSTVQLWAKTVLCKPNYNLANGLYLSNDKREFMMIQAKGFDALQMIPP